MLQLSALNAIGKGNFVIYSPLTRQVICIYALLAIALVLLKYRHSNEQNKALAIISRAFFCSLKRFLVYLDAFGSKSCWCIYG